MREPLAPPRLPPGKGLHGTAARPARAAHPERVGTSMVNAAPGADLMLLPGQLYFGNKPARLQTLLGSCVAITLWHPMRRLGGMCHFLLPSRPNPPSGQPDGRFGEEAVAMLVKALKAIGTTPAEYEAHLYGGADTRANEVGQKTGIGERNIEAGWSLIEHHRFALMAVDVGDNVPRNVRLTLATGEVQMRRGAPIRT